tara:strand:+ start:116 stop:412 length:297 start_codon:yes stop_codon:yes gene_type:complete
MDFQAVEQLARMARDKSMATFDLYNEQTAEIEADYSAAWERMNSAKTDADLKEAWQMMHAAGDRDLANMDRFSKWMEATHETIIGRFLDSQTGESKAS